MYSRSDSLTLTVQPERFAFSGMATRSTEPEVFTFERVPAPATAVRSYVPIRPKKRCTRVMYPAKVRMHLPPPERSQAKRWLLVLCLVVLWQIYIEDPCADAPLGSADASISDYQSFSLPSADDPGRQLELSPDGAALLPAPASSCDAAEPVRPDGACLAPAHAPAHDADTGRSFEQSAGKSYMVALLVYHRLGNDN